MKSPNFIYIIFFALTFTLLPNIIYPDFIGEFYAYPNPTSQNQTIHIYLNNISKEEININLNLFSLSGKKMASIVEDMRLTPGLGMLKEFNMQNSDIPIEPGLYILIAKIKGIMTKKEEEKTFKIFIKEEGR